jgi:pseudaminic acid synthase
MSNKIGIIIQARVGSTRLPNKVLMDISGQPLLKHVVERCKLANVDDVIVATSTNLENDAIEEFCKENGYSYFRGSENNVLDRFYQTAKKFNLDAIIRVTGDCPLISPGVIDLLIEKFKEGNFDYASNAAKRSFPRGLDCEIFSFNALEKTHYLAKEQKDCEHVTPFIYGNPEIFKVGHLIADQDLYHPEIRLCVDTEKDFELIKKIYDKFSGEEILQIKKVLQFLLENPKLIKLNQEEEILQQKQNLEEGTKQEIKTSEKLLLKKVDTSDVDFLFDLRNKDYVYKYSLNPNPIEYQEHLTWITPVLRGEGSKKLLYVIKYEDERAGQVRFDILEDHVVEVNISVLKEFHGKGISNFALEEGIRSMKEKGFEKVLAEVFEENTASVKFFEKQGFEKLKNVRDGLGLYEYKICEEVMFKIKDREIGGRKPVFIIAELSGNHLQDFDKAKKLIRKAYEAGADAIKIQTYTADTISINKEGVKKEILEKHHKVKIDNPDWKGRSYHELYQKVYTPWDWHRKLEKIANEFGLPLFSTPFDFTSVDFLEEQNVPFYKVASYDLVNIPLIKKIAQTGKPVIMSVGMATEEEINDAVNTLKENGCSDYSLLHCISSYPVETKDLNLAKIQDLKKKYGCVVGFSDHSLDVNAPAMAVSLGAKIIERHITLGRNLGGPDSSFSSEPHEFKDFVDKVRQIENFGNLDLAYGKVKYGPTNDFEKGGISARPSIWAGRNIAEGKIISAEDLKIVRPSDGLKPKHYESLIGKKARVNIDKGIPFSLDLIEN